MSDNNVKYDTIQANKLILGNEEDGFIELGVNNTDDGPALVIVSRDNSEGGVILGFRNGHPVIWIANKDGDKEESVVSLGFGKEGLPVLKMSSKNNSNSIILGLSDNGTPELTLFGGTDGESAIRLEVDADGALYLLLLNGKGGRMSLRAGDDSAGVMFTSRDRIEDGENWGVFMYSDSSGSVLNVEGKDQINEPRQNKEVDSGE